MTKELAEATRKLAQANLQQVTDDTIRKLAAKGITICQIAAEVGLSYNGVWRRMNKMGIPRNPRGRPQGLTEESRMRAKFIKEQRRKGRTFADIAAQLGISPQRVSQITLHGHVI